MRAASTGPIRPCKFGATSGSVALPLWKEVHRDFRFRHKNIRIYHECANIDLAVRVTSPAGADRMRKAGSRVVADLNGQDVHLNIAHHTFSIHLIDHASGRYIGRYIGMVCHFNQCPKHKRECQVPGCALRPDAATLPTQTPSPERIELAGSVPAGEGMSGNKN